MRKNIKKLILSSFLIILPALLVAIFGKHLPYEVSDFPCILISAIMLAVHLVCIAFTEYDNRRGQSKKIMTMIYYIIPIVNAFAFGITFIAASDSEVDMFLLTSIFMGVIFLIVGNYLPKCKRNRTIGVKIKWTLESDANWNATHRFAGKVWVIGGLLFIVCAFLPETVFIPLLIVSVLVLAFVPMAYSYLFYKRAVKNGEFTKDHDYGVSAPSKKVKVMSIVVAVLFLAAMIPLLFTGDVEVSFGDGSFTVDASFCSDATLNYTDITEVTFIENTDSDIREFGMASARLLAGSFRNEKFGKYTRYTYTFVEPAVIVRTEKGIYMINLRTEAETENLYRELSARVKNAVKR